jgi:DNA segregation ATPase FtsK/SpoIIIE-like protein
VQIDEKDLLQKAQELQAKLAEFNIPVEIAGYEI